MLRRRRRRTAGQRDGQGALGRYWHKVLAVLLAATLLVVAVVAADAVSWLRGALVAGAIGLLLLARRWEQAAWPDVAALAVAALAGCVAVAAATADEPPAETPQTVPFVVAAEKAVAATPLPKASAIVVVTLEPDKADSGTVLTFVSTRYEATLCHGLARGRQRRDVAITVVRGDADANASAFAADLRGADTVQLLPTANKKEEEKDKDEAGDTAKTPPLPVGCPPRTALTPKPQPLLPHAAALPPAAPVPAAAATAATNAEAALPRLVSRVATPDGRLAGRRPRARRRDRRRRRRAGVSATSSLAQRRS